MKHILAGALALLVILYTPFRLVAVTTEAIFMHPGDTHMSQDTDRYWDVLELEARLVGMSWAVGYEAPLSFMGQSAYGLTNTGEHTIRVDANLRWNARLAVLAHEGGHTLEPWWCDRDQGEVFAEMVATLVAKDGFREHARYLSRTKGTAVMMLILEWQSVYHAAAVLEDQ
jgi:hypothetical protein